MWDSQSSERLKTILFYAVVLLLGYLVYQIFKPFLVPLAWAGVLVVVFYPLHVKLEARFKRTRAAYASTLLVTVVLIVPVLLLGIMFVNQGISAFQALNEAREHGEMPFVANVEKAWFWVRQRLPVSIEMDPVKIGTEAAQIIGRFVADRASDVARNVAVFLFNLSVMVFALFFFFRDASRIVDAIRKLLPFDDALKDQMLSQARGLIEASVTSTLVVAAVQGLLGGLAFLFLGFGAPVVWGVVMAFFALIPLAGTWLVWGPAVISLFVSGDWVRGVILLAIGAGLVGSVDNVLRPILVSGRAQLSQLLIFISILGGISVFGMLGLVLGPIVIATAAALMQAYTKLSPVSAKPTPAAAPPG